MPSRTDWRTHVDDISVPGQVAPITEHDFRYWLEVLPPRWASGANFCFAEGEKAFRLFWTESDGGYFVRQLSDDETLLFCDLAGIKPPLIDRGSVSRPTDDGSPWVTVVLPTET